MADDVEDVEQVEDGPDDFLVALRKAVRPEVLAEAAAALAEVTAAVHEERAKGKFTLVLDFKPVKNTAVVEVTATTKAAPPTPDPSPQLLWTTPSGRLQRSDPRQMRMDIHAVDDGDEKRSVQ